MKCENCGNELVGASIVCRQCNHNNAQGRVSQWRARRSGELQPVPAAAQATTRTISPLASPATAKPEIKRTIVEPKAQSPIPPPPIPIDQHRRSNPAPAPLSNAAAPTASENQSEVVELPAWRAQLKEKVKQVRERRSGELQPIQTEPDEAQLDPNPIVESALKRIRWSQHSQPITTNPAPAVSESPKHETESRPFARTEPSPERTAESRPVPKPQPAIANPLLARKPAPQPAQPPDTAALAQRQTVKTEPARQTAETRIRVEFPAPPNPAAKPPSEPAPTAPNIRTTGEIKPPVAERRTDSGSLAQPPRNHVETRVIGLAPALNSVIGYANTATTNQQAEIPDTNPFAKPSTATLWVRTLAGACDLEIVAIAYLPLFWAYAVLNTSFGIETVAILFVLLAALGFCYQFLSLTIANRTTGMAFLKLRLVNIADKNHPVAFRSKLLRAAGATAAMFLPPINFLVMQSNPRHHSLPDLLSGTTLIERTRR
mgnify:CR=1 FL=1